jgi:hypothetical protein
MNEKIAVASADTRPTYRSKIERFRQAMVKPLAWITMADLHGVAAWAGKK